TYALVELKEEKAAPEIGTEPQLNQPQIPNTGDRTKTVFYVIVAGAAILAIVVLVVISKKKK
ncbi:MAG: LPXTG cell wall anchor domain-containing protein, partial [Beduini sp.]